MAEQDSFDWFMLEELLLESGEITLKYCYPNSTYCRRHQIQVNEENRKEEKNSIMLSSEELPENFVKTPKKVTRETLFERPQYIRLKCLGALL